MSTLKFDEHAWPLVHLRIAGSIAAEDIARMVEHMRGLIAKPDNFCLIVDLTECDVVPLSLATEMQRLIAPVRDDLRRKVLGTAMIVKSGALRAAANALLLVIRLPHPTRLVATQQEAEEYCRAALAYARKATG